MDGAGNLYGTTIAGGASTYNGGGTKCSNGCGVVFELAPPAVPGNAWQYTILHKFRQGADGAHPFAGVTMDSAGALYGTTRAGGNQLCPNNYVSFKPELGCGVVYRLKPPVAPSTSWTEQILYRFGNNVASLGQGSLNYPPEEVLVDSAGNVFGGAPAGGKNKQGIVFELTPENGGASYRPSVVHAFTSATLISAPIMDSAGALYLTTSAAGATGYGGIFKFTPPTSAGGAWGYTILHNFNVHDSHPVSTLLMEPDGGLLGLTQELNGSGGTGGTIYQYTP